MIKKIEKLEIVELGQIITSNGTQVSEALVNGAVSIVTQNDLLFAEKLNQLVEPNFREYETI